MEEVKKVLEDILKEMQWHSRQNEKLLELLGSQKRPCGDKKVTANMLKILESMPNLNIDPTLAGLLKAVKEVVKDGD